MVTLYSFNGVDYGYFAVIVLSMILGAWKGFARSLLAALIWLAAFVIPGVFSELLAPCFSRVIDNTNGQLFLAMGSLFLGVLIIGWILGWVIKKSIQEAELSGMDRFLGLIFGVFRGIALLAVVTALVSLTTLSQTEAWQKSVLVKNFETAMINILSVFPGAWTETIEQKIIVSQNA